MNEPRYNIRAVERMTGVPAPTLRSWERRYGFPSPQRTLTARRLYSEDDLRLIRWVREQTDRGVAAAQAIASARNPVPGSLGPPQPAAGATDLVDALVRAVTAYDEPAVEAVLSTAFAQSSPDTVLLDVITPALVEIGEQWARGEISVTAEHFGSNLVRRRLLALIAAQPAISYQMTAVLACLPGEQHELGLLMLAVFLRWSGARVLYLGADVPVSDLVGLYASRQLDAICLSAGSETSLTELPELVEGIRARGSAAHIYLGGAAATGASVPPGVTVLNGDLRHAAQVITSGISLRRTG